MRRLLDRAATLAAVFTLAIASFTGCASKGTARVSEITITPREATLAPGATQKFETVMRGEVEGAHVVFELFDEHGDPCPPDSAARYGSVGADGVYTAPATPIVVEVRALSSADRLLFARARVVVGPQISGG